MFDLRKAVAESARLVSKAVGNVKNNAPELLDTTQ